MDVLLRRESDREGGHPCFTYTKIKILEIENERRRQSEALERLLDRSKMYHRAARVERHYSRTIHSVLSITAIFIVIFLLFLLGLSLAGARALILSIFTSLFL